MKHFNTIQRIIRAGALGGDMQRPVRELALAIAAEAESAQDPASLEMAAWLRRWDTLLGDARKRGPDAPTLATERAAHDTARLDPVQGLLRRGAIDSNELAAAQRLERMFALLAGGMDIKARDYREARVDGGGTSRDPVDRMSERDAAELNLVFRPWAVAMQEIDAGMGFRPGRDGPVPVALREDEGIRRILGLSIHDLVRAVLVDRRTLRGLEVAWRVRHGSLTTPLVMGLRQYGLLHERAGRKVGQLVAEATMTSGREEDRR